MTEETLSSIKGMMDFDMRFHRMPKDVEREKAIEVFDTVYKSGKTLFCIENEHPAPTDHEYIRHLSDCSDRKMFCADMDPGYGTGAMYYVVDDTTTFYTSSISKYLDIKKTKCQSYFGLSEEDYEVPTYYVDEYDRTSLLKTMFDYVPVWYLRKELEARRISKGEYEERLQGQWFVWDTQGDEGPKWKQYDDNENWRWWLYEGHFATLSDMITYIKNSRSAVMLETEHELESSGDDDSKDWIYL